MDQYFNRKLETLSNKTEGAPPSLPLSERRTEYDRAAGNILAREVAAVLPGFPGGEGHEGQRSARVEKWWRGRNSAWFAAAGAG